MAYLPAQSTSFIGREREVIRLRSLLRREDVRVVTLTGPGGIGKSRLAIQVANGLLDDFDAAVFFVSLASINDPALVASAVAYAVGAKEISGQSVADSLKEYLRDQYLLLVLDNFEHVLQASAFVLDVLQNASRVEFLITSRSALRIYGENEFPLLPLELPDPDRLEVAQTDLVARLQNLGAVRLFVERAQAVKPSFQLTSTNAVTVAQICARLDGLPLAIELAAARVRLLSPQVLLDRLTDRFAVLSGGIQGLPERQRTLRSTIDWSYALLTAEEQTLFRRLAVFVDGFTLAAAETVCNPDGDLKIDVLEGLQSLLDKSLLRQDEAPEIDGDLRCGMLETIHEYALDRLEESSGAEVLRSRHAAYYLQLAEQAEQESMGAQQAVWLQRLELERGNLRAALQRAVDGGHAELAARLSGALWHFWQMHGHLNEGWRWLTAALSISDGLPAAIRVKAVTGAAVLAERQGEHEQAVVLFEQSRALAQELDDCHGIAFALNGLANVAMNLGDVERARPLYEESLTLRRTAGDGHGIIQSLNNLGWAALEQGELGLATSLLEESLSRGRATGDLPAITRPLHHLGLVAWEQEDYEKGRALLEESLAVRQEVNDRWGIAESLEALGGLAAAQGQPIHALHLAGAAATLRATIGAPLFPIGKARLDHWLEPARSVLDAEAIEQAWRAGQSMTPSQALSEAEPKNVPMAIRIDVDQQKQADEVDKITNTDLFQQLRQRAEARRRKAR